MLSIQDVFDSNYYLSQNQDVAAAVNQGAFTNAFAHFSAFGKNENREISIFFKTSYYLDKNQDVAAAVNNKQTTAIDHFLSYGQFEDRNSTEFFNSTSYRRKNKDVDDAIKATSGSGKLTALEHFVKYGQFEQRDSSDFFNTKFYLTRNQDVDQAVKNGQMTAFSHFVNFGQWEQRDSSIFFSNSFYLTQNQDVNAAVQQKQMSGIGHFIKYGKEEKRDAIALFNTAFYLSNNPDVNNVVTQGLITAMDHFTQFGVFENRNPSTGFNAVLLLANNSQVAALINNGTFANAFDYYVQSQSSFTTVTDLGKLSGIKTLTDQKVGGVNNQSTLFKFTLDNATSNFSLALDGSSKNINLQFIQDQNNNGIIDQGDVLKASTNPGILPDEINNLNLSAGNYFVRVIQPADFGNETAYTLSLSTQGSVAQANKQVVKGFFDAFQQSWQNNDLNAQLFPYIDQNFKSDAQYLVIDKEAKAFSEETAAMLGYIGEYDGIAGVQNFFTRSNNDRTVEDFTVSKYVAQGNNVGVFGHYVYRAKGSGDKLEADWGAVVELHDGKIAKYQSYEDTYMAAAGYRDKTQSFTWDTKFEGRTIHITSGTNNNDNFTGTTGFDENAIFGYKGDDTLTASSTGNDYLDGGTGNNTLIGGGGINRFVVSQEGKSTINNFEVGKDKLVLQGDMDFSKLTISQNGANTEIKLTSNNLLLATLTGITSTQLTNTDFILEPLKTNNLLNQDKNPQNVTPGTEIRNAEVVTGFFASFVKTPTEFFNYVVQNYRDDVQYLVNGNESTLFGSERKALLPHSGYYNGKTELLEAFDSLANKQVIPLSFVITKTVSEGNSVLAFGQFKFQSRATSEIFYSDLAVDMELDQSGKIAKYFFLEDSYSVVTGYRFKDTSAQNLNWNTTFNGISRNILTGSNQNDNLTAGNMAQENFVLAYQGDDTLTGGTGNNTLDGGTGNNTLTGGTGNNRFIIQKDSLNTITNFNNTKDKLVLRGDLSFDKLVITQNGGNTEISVKNSDGSTGVKLAILQGITSSITANLFSQDGIVSV